MPVLETYFAAKEQKSQHYERVRFCMTRCLTFACVTSLSRQCL